MATGLVLAIAVGTMAQNSGSLMAFLTGEDISIGNDDQYTIRAGNDQVLDVLANDKQFGNISVIDQPACGTVQTTQNNTLEFINSGSCTGDMKFSYCVPVAGACEAFNVTLNVINVPDNTPIAPETKVASVALPTTSSPAVSPATEPGSYKQGDRLSAGQILVTDVEEDVVVSGFGADNGPSLFAPNMDELIQPQETVATLRKSVEVVAPSRIDQDQNIQTQTSAASPARAETAANTQQDNIPLGTESSPIVAFFTPSQPHLTRPSALAPLNFVPDSTDVLDHGPDVSIATPTQVASADSDDTTILAPANFSIANATLTSAAMTLPSSGVDPVSADTTSAPIGNILIASGSESTKSAENSTTETAMVNLGANDAPAISDSPAMVVFAESILVEVGPEVISATPNGFALEETTIDNLVASISGSEGYIAPVTSVGETLQTQTSPDTAASPEVQTASVGPISINAADPADSSDIVVEMAAQILLPAPQLNNALSRYIQPTPATEALLSDKLFAADLEESAPPSSDPVEVASISPVISPDTILNASAQARCGVRMSASARPGAAIAVFVSSLCRPNQVVTLSHADFSFSARTDARGVFSTNIPAFTNFATIDVIFDDGATANAQVSLRDATELERMAIVWSVPVNLDLHAFEGNATERSEGHVWVNNSRSYRDTLIGGGGFLETFGDSSIEGGSMAEVYSLPTSRIRRQTSVSLDLRINDIDAYCAQPMALRTVRSENGGEITKREFNLRLPQCGIASGGLILEDFVENIGVASN